MSDLVLDEIEMAESFGFRDLTSSNKASESSRSPIRRPKYQCYDCGGDPMISQICRTCCGTKTVTDSNPMVMFLNSLMAYKLGNEPPPPPENPSLKPQFSQIKEEQGPITCDNCNCEIENTDYMECLECCHYNICIKCHAQVHHQHQLIRKRTEDIFNKSSEIDEESWLNDNNGDDEEPEPNQMLKKSSSKVEPKHCCSLCQAEFTDKIILICLTCKENGVTFEICQNCERNSEEKHIKHHILRPSLYKTPSFKEARPASPKPKYSGNWIDPTSEAKKSEIVVYDESSENGYESVDDSDHTLKVPGQISKPRASLANNVFFKGDDGGKSVSPEKKSQMSSRIKVSFDESDSEYDEPPKNLFQSTNLKSSSKNEKKGLKESTETQKMNPKESVKSRDRKARLQAPVENDYKVNTLSVPIKYEDITTPSLLRRDSNRSSQRGGNRSRSATPSHGKKKIQRSNASEQSETSSVGNVSHESLEEQAEPFQFSDYTCNYCDEVPVNYRYHCTICSDYDLCTRCYKNRNQLHPLHDSFKRMDRNDEMEHLAAMQEKKKKNLASILNRLGAGNGSGRNSDSRPVFKSHVATSSNKKVTNLMGSLRMSYC